MKLQFDDTYFKGETIDGFYVDPLMKRSWAAQMEVLAVIDDICNTYNIHYFAEWGTLLGAVRHKGFIPWDDDMDIGMLREDMIRFQKIAPEVLPEGFELINYNTEPDWDNILIRVMNGKRVNIDEDYLDRFHGCPFAVGIDIFPIDYIPENPADYDMQINLIAMLYAAKNAYATKGFGLANARYYAVQVEEALNVKIDETGNVNRQLLQLIDAVSAMYGPEDTNSMGIPLRTSYAGDQRLPKECYTTLLMQPFEGTQIPIPIGYHEILSNYYDDYMKEDRTPGHDYPFYEEQLGILKNYLQQNPQVYSDRLKKILE
ncbi:MAG: LicD family protein [Lachnospiraceae bacterium]|nr:LicD family protein [Lachnospiraceae bacterium]MCR4731807.1 LicD family protein [Lachnospiraceae bacterium]